MYIEDKSISITSTMSMEFNFYFTKPWLLGAYRKHGWLISLIFLNKCAFNYFTRQTSFCLLLTKFGRSLTRCRHQKHTVPTTIDSFDLIQQLYSLYRHFCTMFRLRSSWLFKHVCLVLEKKLTSLLIWWKLNFAASKIYIEIKTHFSQSHNLSRRKKEIPVPITIFTSFSRGS